MVTRNFWWPGITREVKRYVEGCDACQHNKNRTEQPAGKLMPNSIPDKAWTHISADFITKLPLAQGYCHKLLLSPSNFIVIPFLYLSIYSVGNSITPCDIMRDKSHQKKVTSQSRSHVTSQDISHVVWLGVWDN